MNEISVKYGEFIKNKRVLNGQTQAEVAKALGISQQAYSRYEKGIREPNFELIMKISDVLGFRPSEFFDNYMERSGE